MLNPARSAESRATIGSVDKQAFDRKLDEIQALRADPSPENALRKALADRNNYLVAKAAAIMTERGFHELIPVP